MLGVDVTAQRPYERPIGMVFQNYALFPHLTVAGNVAFGLEERRVPRADIAGRVERALDLVRLDPQQFSGRRPTELSGGQQQRVALARALVLEPPILLLDEPLAALDLQLRKEMQLELRALNRRLSITFLLVTHDQDEALVMSDRIAVMHAGRVEQVGTPAEIYERPRTRFVAGFIGEANFLADRTDDGQTVTVAVRPERLVLHSIGATPEGWRCRIGTVRETVFLGGTIHVMIELSTGDVVRAAVRNEGVLARPLPWQAGDLVEVAWRPDDAQVLTA